MSTQDRKYCDSTRDPAAEKLGQHVQRSLLPKLSLYGYQPDEQVCRQALGLPPAAHKQAATQEALWPTSQPTQSQKTGSRK